MPVFKFKPKNSTVSLDQRRKSRVAQQLHRLSVSRRASQLREAKQKPLTRITVKGTIRLNSSGNLRGMNTVHDSAHFKKIRAMRKIYNRQMPVLQCSTCAFATSCPQFKAGFECAYLPYLNSHKLENERDLMDGMKNLAEASLSRVHRAAMMETLTGGMPSLETSESLNIAFMQLKDLHTKIVEADTLEVTAESEDGTIIGKLFGGIEQLVGETEEAHNSPIVLDLPVISEKDSLALPPASPDVNLDLVKEHTRDELEGLTGVSQTVKTMQRPKPSKVGAVTISTLKKAV